jgi:hypothetical protein
MEHIEEAGIHSGDSAMVLPPYTLSKEIIETIKENTYALAKELDVKGLLNIQYAVKNNIVYGDNSYYLSVNRPSFYMGDILPTSTNTIVNNFVTSDGDPKFVNPDLTKTTSITLPDLNLQSFSPAIDGGIHLTEASGAGTNSITLVVDDVLYFQDATWGSDLARGITLFPDWIAIGSVSNVVQIQSINYATNRITLASPMTWTDNAPVWLYKKSDGAIVLQGSAPDMGAYEYYGEGSQPIPGDINGDGDVDINDLSFVGGHFGQKNTHPLWNATADVVANNEIDVYEVVFVASRFKIGRASCRERV